MEFYNSEEYKPIKQIRIDNAEKLVYSLTDDYIEDGEVLFALIEAVRDSLYGDEFKEGKKTIILADKFNKWIIKEGDKVSEFSVDASNSEAFRFSEGTELYSKYVFNRLSFLPSSIVYNLISKLLLLQ